MNIIKWTLYFPGFVLCHVLVACCLMMVRCTVDCRIYDLWLLWMYKQTIAWKWTGPLKHCNINIVTSILTQNKLKCTSCLCSHLMLQKWEIGKKVGKLLWFAKFTKVFYCTVCNSAHFLWNQWRNFNKVLGVLPTSRCTYIVHFAYW